MDSQVSSSTRTPYFIEDDDNGLASISGISCNNHNNTNIINHGYPLNNHHYTKYNNCRSGGIMMYRRNSLRNISCLNSYSSSVLSPRSNGVYDEIQSPYFLEACALCKKLLGANRDIFMYRGDTPYCSEECRQEQIEIDEANEKNRNYKALRTKKDVKKSSVTNTTASSSSSSSKSQNHPFRTGTVAAA